LVTDNTVVPVGIPVPDNTIPASKPAVEFIVNTLLALFVTPPAPIATPALNVGFVAEKVTRFVVALNACPVTKLIIEPPPGANAPPPNVNVAFAAPALFNVTRFAPQVETNPPNVSAEAAVPLAVKSNAPVASVSVRPVPPNRVRCVPVSSNCNTPPYCTVMFPDVAVN
jgi:hypothetical protein